VRIGAQLGTPTALRYLMRNAPQERQSHKSSQRRRTIAFAGWWRLFQVDGVRHAQAAPNALPGLTIKTVLYPASIPHPAPQASFRPFSSPPRHHGWRYSICRWRRSEELYPAPTTVRVNAPGHYHVARKPSCSPKPRLD